MNAWNLLQPTGDDQKRILIALENLDLIRRGFYQIGEQRIPLRNAEHCDLSKVLPYAPQALDRIRFDFSVQLRKQQGKKMCSVCVTNGDSLQAAAPLEYPLVLNFAHPCRPGGGFLYGAISQEESLCRAGSLYASLSSAAAGQMYDYNREQKCPVDSDYMLLSPDVCVFRNADGELLHRPHYISVLTVPAPDRNGSARAVSDGEIEAVIRKRLQNIFSVAALHQYRSLVLGAWGCGAFGNDPHMVARCFYDVLVAERYGVLFDTVIFAIPGDQEKLDIFRNRFSKQ